MKTRKTRWEFEPNVMFDPALFGLLARGHNLLSGCPNDRLGDYLKEKPRWQARPVFCKLRAIPAIQWVVLTSCEVFVHGKPTEVSTSAFDVLFGIKLETVAIEEWTGSQTDMGGNAGRRHSTQRRLGATIEMTGDAAPSECGMSEEKVQITLKGISSETCECAFRLGNDGVKLREALLPACGIGWNGCPRGELRW